MAPNTIIQDNVAYIRVDRQTPEIFRKYMQHGQLGRYLWEGKLFQAGVEEWPEGSFTVYMTGAEGYDGPHGVQIDQAPLYVPYNSTTASDLSAAFARLSRMERQRLMAFNPDARARSFALRGGLNRALASGQFTPTDIPVQVDGQFYREYMSHSRPDVKYLYQGKMYSGMVEMGMTFKDYRVYFDDDRYTGPQGVPLSDVTMYTKRVVGTGGPNMAAILESSKMLPFVDLT